MMTKPNQAAALMTPAVTASSDVLARLHLFTACVSRFSGVLYIFDVLQREIPVT